MKVGVGYAVCMKGIFTSKYCVVWVLKFENHRQKDERLLFWSKFYLPQWLYISYCHTHTCSWTAV